MDEYLCLTVLSRSGEDQAGFSGRLSTFWTFMLRSRKDDFEKVYAETTSFDIRAGHLSRKYLVAEEIVEIMVSELARAGIDFEALDRDDVYSKYEAVPPEWMQIEH